LKKDEPSECSGVKKRERRAWQRECSGCLKKRFWKEERRRAEHENHERGGPLVIVELKGENHQAAMEVYRSNGESGGLKA